jgi:hypothetical protein
MRCDFVAAPCMHKNTLQNNGNVDDMTSADVLADAGGGADVVLKKFPDARVEDTVFVRDGSQ